MKHKLLLSAAICATWAVADFAAAQPAQTYTNPPSDQRDHQRGPDHERGRPPPAGAPAPHRPGQAAPAPGAHPGGRPDWRADQGGPTPQRGPGPGQGGRQSEHAWRAPPNTPRLGEWNRNARGRDRQFAGQQWRQQHGGWDRTAAWHRGRDWWRGYAGFRGYNGRRVGFFFAPSYGYIPLPVVYQHRYWRAGEFLPRWFWRFEVRDFWTYGLPEPPYGCAWIWLNGNVALVDLSDGYILDMVYNVW